ANVETLVFPSRLIVLERVMSQPQPSTIVESNHRRLNAKQQRVGSAALECVVVDRLVSLDNLLIRDRRRFKLKKLPHRNRPRSGHAVFKRLTSRVSDRDARRVLSHNLLDSFKLGLIHRLPRSWVAAGILAVL